MNPTNLFLKATGDLLGSMLETFDDEVRENLSMQLAAGAMLQIQTSWARHGHVETVLVLIRPNGERSELAALELAQPRVLS